MTKNAQSRRHRGVLAPNEAMWSALGRGPRLRAILEDFYARVYADPVLIPFFERTSIDWVIDHQYAFLAEIFSGTKHYFGDRPRNAHSWMVISDEVFDHREALLEAVLRLHGLDDELVRVWRSVDEAFRSHIVKDAPIARKRRGIAMPLEGYESLDLLAGAVCDGCGSEMSPGARAIYHVRTGQTYCVACRADDAATDGSETASRT